MSYLPFSCNRVLISGLCALVSTGCFASAQAAESKGFLSGIKKITTISSTVPENGDQNPYAIVVSPVDLGTAVASGDVLVTNFNNDKNLQGLGTTIVAIRPSNKKMTVFAKLPRMLDQCPGGIGLSTALAVLKSGYVVVGSAPSTDGTTKTRGEGCLLILNAKGEVAGSIKGPKINMPWGNIATVDDGNTATLFVSNAGFGVGAPGEQPADTKQATVLRINLSTPEGKTPIVVDETVVGSGFGAHGDKDVFLVGPTGLTLGANNTLYVSDAAGNSVSAITNATKRADSAGTGTLVTKDGMLKRPLAMATAPNGHLIVTNGLNGQAIEVDPASGTQISSRWIDPNKAQTPPGSGDLFGIAMTQSGDGFYFVKDEVNTLALAK